eukprot:jgi/Ulvmu1/5389/UM022_0184.1
MLRVCATVLAIVISTCVGVVVVLDSAVPEPRFTHACVDVAVQDPDASIAHVRGFLRFPTVSQSEAVGHVTDPEVFKQARTYIEDTYTELLHMTGMQYQVVAEHSLLLEWQGSNTALRPLMLYGHYDVVPVGNGTEVWKFDPFSAELHDGMVWARGAIDMKSALIAMLEALSQLARTGFRPTRTVLLGIGHDEEVGGSLGAGGIATVLEQRGVRLGLLWDEGTPVLLDGLPGLLPQPVAMIGTAEKGNAAFRVSVSTQSAHSAMPPTDGSHSGRVLADLLHSVDVSQPPIRMQPPVSDMLRAFAPHAPRGLRGIMHHAEMWPINKVLGQIWSASGREMNAQVRTTVVPTHVTMGVSHNVIPSSATVRLDVRLLQGDGDAATILQHVQRITAGARRDHASVLNIEQDMSSPVPLQPPSNVSEPRGPWWDLLVRAIQETATVESMPGLPQNGHVPVVPGMLTGGTDSKNLGHLADSVFRFLPIPLDRTKGDLKLVHGIDERLPTAALLSAIRIYIHAISLMASDTSAR